MRRVSNHGICDLAQFGIPDKRLVSDRVKKYFNFFFSRIVGYCHHFGTFVKILFYLPAVKEKLRFNH